MNKTFNINLGGYPFSIDEDAFNYIQNYLETIRKHFSASEGCDEILYDIEVRMAELFQEHLKGRAIISMKEIDEVIMIMGKPEDFGAEPMSESSYTNNRNRKADSSIKVGKRLFRDPDDQKLGGVCSGIAAYFGIEDPLWVRLAVVGLFFTGGIGLFGYIIMWILIPEASSSGDKLAMRGEPSTIQNIAKLVEDEMSEFGEKINEWSRDLGSKKKGKAIDGDGFRAKSLLANAVNVFGNIVGGIIPVIKAVFKPFFIIIGILLLSSMAIAWGASVVGISYASPVLASFGPSSAALTYLGIIGLIITLTVPIISLMLFVARLAFGYRVHKSINPIVWTVWFVALFTTIAAGVKTLHEYDANFKNVSMVDYNIENPNIIISSPEEDIDRSFGVHIGNKFVGTGDKWAVKDVRVKIERSKDNLVHIEKTTQGRGINQDQAKKIVSLLNNEISVVGNEIIISKYITYPKSSKYRNQEVDYVIYVPEGKTLSINNNMKDVLAASEVFSWDQINSDLDNLSWTVGNSGVNSPDWENIHHFKKDINTDTYSKVIIEQNVEVHITQGKNQQITINGRQDEVNKIDYRNLAGTLTIMARNGENPQDVVVDIVVPSLDLIYLDDVSSAIIEGFVQDNMKLVFKSKSNYHSEGNISFIGNIKSLDITIDGDQKVSLSGSGNHLDLNMAEGSLDADKYIVKTVNFSGQNYSQANMYITDEFIQDSLDNQDRIKIIGSPKMIKK